MSTGVLVALSGPAEGELVQALDAPGTGLRVVRRCADVPEVLAAAAAGLGTLAVLSAAFPGVDRTVVARLRAADVLTVLVAAGPDRRRCEALGADAVEDELAPTAALAERVVTLARARAERAAGNGHGGAADAGNGRARTADAENRLADAGRAQTHDLGPDPGGAADGADGGRTAGPARAAAGSGRDHGARHDAGAPDPGGDDVPDARADAEATEGKLVAVWGPPGAPGRTTVAVTLAAELAALRGDALLIDADTEAPSVAQVLGLLDDSSAIAVAARQATHGRLDPAALARLSPAVDGTLRVLTGLTRADRWRELPGAALETLWATARLTSPWSVVDLGAGIEVDGRLDPTFGPQRHQATAAALAAADVVVVVGAGEPVGMRRLVVALGDLAEHASVRPGAERVVVVNRVRSSAAGPGPERSIVEALARFAGVTDAILVPDDRPALDKAVLQGGTLTRVAPASPARAALHALASRLAGVPQARRGRRRPAVLARFR
ncbi:CpaE family protein [Georgenia sp. AZ-5]|uniref:AAA family ATPase n=1 Tax=Georgenia sp. AZ-5 TaxID=3367526 RepID=UPI0037549B21